MQLRIGRALVALVLCIATFFPENTHARHANPTVAASSAPLQSTSPFPLPSPSASPTFPSATISSAASPPTIDLRQLQIDYQILRERLDSNAEKTNHVTVLLALLVGMFAFSGFVWFQSEKRASESHGLMVLGEKSSQGRDVSIFEQSQRTLSLVNATLELAKEASARASKSLENRLKKTSHELEKQCLDLIEEAEAFKNDKNLVSTRETTSRIHSLGLRIKGLANNLVLLEDDTLKLEPYCGLINGIDSHLHEDYTEAISSWESVSTDKDTPAELKSLAFYWLGYIHNNLRKFKKATQNLDRALENASGSRRFELRRLHIESRFFLKDDGDDLIRLLEKLLQEFDQEFLDQSDTSAIETKRRIQTTLGNICFQTGNEKATSDYYERSKGFFKEAGENAKWGSFGLAETLFKLKDTANAVAFFKGPVMKEAEKEFMGREELRTKVLAKTTQLVCAVRTRLSAQHIKDRHDDVISLLADVDSRLTIYSQMQRRNVSKEDFLRDLQVLTAQDEEQPSRA